MSLNNASRLVGTIVLGGVIVSEAFGVGYTAEGLRHDCKALIKCIGDNDFCPSDADLQDANTCNGYIKGFWDGRYIGMAEVESYLIGTITFVGDELAKKYGQYCQPEGVASYQAAEVFVKYMDNHPEYLHRKANEMLLLSFVEAFPCE